MKRKYLVIILLFITIIGFILYNQLPNMEPIYVVKKLVIANTNEQLFLKSKTWGMTYDSKLIVLATNDMENFIADSTKDYVYRGASFLFYRVYNDSLFIYTANKAYKPQVFDSKFKIKQIELDNPAMMKLKKDGTYKRQGLMEFR